MQQIPPTAAVAIALLGFYRAELQMCTLSGVAGCAKCKRRSGDRMGTEEAGHLLFLLRLDKQDTMIFKTSSMHPDTGKRASLFLTWVAPCAIGSKESSWQLSGKIWGLAKLAKVA